MNKLDRLYRKALQVVGNKEERERFHRSLRATAVFSICVRTAIIGGLTCRI